MRTTKMIAKGRSVCSYWKWILGLKVLKQFGNNTQLLYLQSQIKISRLKYLENDTKAKERHCVGGGNLRNNK